MHTWNHIIDLLRSHAAGTIVRIDSWQVPHPRDAGLVPTAGLDRRAHCDFRKYLDSTTLLHVRSVEGYYHASLVIVTPLRLQAHQADVTPGALVLGATALGALLGAALGGKNGALAGAIVGGMAGLAAVGLDNAKSSPETAKLAEEMFATLAQSMRPEAVAPASLTTTREVAVAKPGSGAPRKKSSNHP